VNGLRLKLFSFSVRGELVEPQKNTFARASPIFAFIHGKTLKDHVASSRLRPLMRNGLLIQKISGDWL